MTQHRMVPAWLDPDEWDDGEAALAVTAPSPAELAAAGPAGRPALVEEYLRREVAGILQTEPELVDPGRPLVSIGIGSMMGVELQRRILDTLGVELDLTTVLRSPSITELAARTAAALGRPLAAAAGPLAVPAGMG
ncbi:acyl carrier protein [Kitasatospora sp. NPDC059571]|uniref:acyl carrier protein n=1 Tax=Kitasatospora sp. NPDC059571 TaxID=3346871 RepID=UPI0036A6A11C